MTTDSATTRKVASMRRRYAPLEKASAEICALVLDGAADTQIAEWFGTRREAVGRWKDRHRADIEAMRAEVERQVTDAAIASRVERIFALDDRWHRGRQVIEERAIDPTVQDVPGGKTGLLVRQLKQIGSGRDASIVEEYAVDTGLLSSLLAMEKEASDVLGHRPKPDINIDNRKVIIRVYDGWPEQLT